LDEGTADDQLVLLREIGELRQALERERGGISLRVPEQQVTRTESGWELSYEAPLPIEGWNAQISLMTGMAAAELMLYAEVGILRTLPEPSASAIRQMRRVATGLGVSWPPRMSHDEFVRTLDPRKPAHAALLAAATGLLRGAGYVAFDGGVPEQAVHAGVASEYAHATAPLRRLVDRYVGEVCVALCSDVELPTWVRNALPRVAQVMNDSSVRAHQYESAIVSIFEALLLSDRIGEMFDAVVIEVDAHGENALIQLRDPAVIARCSGHLRLGAEVRVRLVEADVLARRVAFDPSDDTA
jgi:exoribonuclease R